MDPTDGDVQKKITTVVFWICVVINNLIAGFLLGITFLTGPSASMPETEIYLRLGAYILIVILVFSLITVGLTALFKRPEVLRLYSYFRLFAAQSALLLVCYLVVYIVVYLNIALRYN